MARRSESKTFLHKHWAKALAVARILFEAEGYHTRYLEEIEAFIDETTTAVVPPADERKEDVPVSGEPPLAAERPYHVDHYPYSRFWAVYAGDELVAVTVYRKGSIRSF